MRALPSVGIARVGTALVGLVLAACARDSVDVSIADVSPAADASRVDDAGLVDDASAVRDAVVDAEPPTPDAMVPSVGPEGGVLRAMSPSGPAELTIPEGALDAPTAIRLRMEPTPPGAAGPLVVVEPEGLALAVPATIFLPTDGDIVDVAGWWSTDAGGFARQGGRVEPGGVSIRVAVLGRGTAAADATWPPPIAPGLDVRATLADGRDAIGLWIEGRDFGGRPVSAAGALSVSEDGTALDVGTWRVATGVARIPARVRVLAPGGINDLENGLEAMLEAMLGDDSAPGWSVEITEVPASLEGALAALGADLDAFRARQGGTPVAGHLIAVVDVDDLAALEATIEARAVRADLSVTIVVRGEIAPRVVAALDELTAGAVFAGPSDDAHGARDLTAAGAMVARRHAAHAVVTWCPATRGRGFEARIAIADAMGPAAIHAFEARSDEPSTCTPEVLDTACDGRGCAGLACGACDEAVAACDVPSGVCMPWCDALERCGGDSAVTSTGVEITCPDRPMATRCGDGCVDLTRDADHCGVCGRRCDGICVEGECRCEQGAVEIRACGPNGGGTERRSCDGSEWTEWTACDDTDECTHGARDVEPCGLNGRGARARDCEAGHWTELGPCEDPDVCEDGSARSAPAGCGRNGRGIRQERCENGAWQPDGECVDSDICVNGDEGSEPCGLNDRGRAARTCLEGRWETATCVDPDACVDNDERIAELGCGFNDRGAAVQRCTEGTWRPDRCVDVDVCVDDTSREWPDACGLNGRGVQTERCVDGGWRETQCADPDLCPDGIEALRPCGLNDRGIGPARCRDGAWTAPDSCDDPDACVDGADRPVSCGLNGRGAAVEACVRGEWTLTPSCDDPDVCVDGAESVGACGYNARGVQPRMCEAGHWEPDGPCDDPDECVDLATEARPCGRNRNGAESFRCFQGIWQISVACVDPDVCIEGTEQIAPCGLNARGNRPERCVGGQWAPEADCDDPDLCVDRSYEERDAVDPTCDIYEMRVCTAGRFDEWSCGFVRIEPGVFEMGSPPVELERFDDETRHTVTLTHPFAIQRTEVTTGQWVAVMGSRPELPPLCIDDCPVRSVDWYAAIAYTNVLSRSRGLRACFDFGGCDEFEAADGAFAGCGVPTLNAETLYACEGWRLPTEAEWEYAARATTSGARYAEPVGSIAWIAANSIGGVQTVAGLPPNAWGLYDVLGNVWEWTFDVYTPIELAPATDPVFTVGAEHRVLRGGGSENDPEMVRSAVRGNSLPMDSGFNVGLRVVRTLPE